MSLPGKVMQKCIHSLLAYGVIGILCLLPFYAICAVTVPFIDIPEAIAPLVVVLSWVTMSWCGSLASGCACRAVLARRYGIVPLVLANSSGWAGLFLLVQEHEAFLQEPVATIPVIIVSSVIGMCITGLTWKVIDHIQGNARDRATLWRAMIEHAESENESGKSPVKTGGE